MSTGLRRSREATVGLWEERRGGVGFCCALRNEILRRKKMRKGKRVSTAGRREGWVVSWPVGWDGRIGPWGRNAREPAGSRDSVAPTLVSLHLPRAQCRIPAHMLWHSRTLVSSLYIHTLNVCREEWMSHRGREKERESTRYLALGRRRRYRPRRIDKR